MRIAIELADAAGERLTERAKQLGVSGQALARAAVEAITRDRGLDELPERGHRTRESSASDTDARQRWPQNGRAELTVDLLPPGSRSRMHSIEMKPWSEVVVRPEILQTFVLTVGLGLFACSGSDSATLPTGAGSDEGEGGNPISASGGDTSAGATTPGGGAANTGGAGVGGGLSSGGMVAAGGNEPAVGGATSAGGTPNTGGTNPAVGGEAPAGGSAATGGVPTATGGTATGGDTATGGAATGGSTAAGGTATGGETAAGGAAAGGSTAAGGNPGTGGTTATGGVSACDAPATHTGGNPTEYCALSAGPVGNGYAYALWLPDGLSGSVCMTVYGVESTFKVDWDLNGYGFVANEGLLFDRTQTAEEIGTISGDFAFTRSGDGQCHIGVYGWLVDPLMEYYVVEDWTVWRPAVDYNLEGTILVNGGEYDVYTNTQVNQPSIQGTTTFQQWWSVRKTGRQCGHVSISEHFAQWASMGMAAGKMHEAKLLVEGFNGSGTVDFTTATVVLQ
jgi:hypothetical protein